MSNHTFMWALFSIIASFQWLPYKSITKHCTTAIVQQTKWKKDWEANQAKEHQAADCRQSHLITVCCMLINNTGFKFKYGFQTANKALNIG